MGLFFVKLGDKEQTSYIYGFKVHTNHLLMKKVYTIQLCLITFLFFAPAALFSQNQQPSNCMAYDQPIVITQPDNSTLTIVGKGNMNRSWTETVDGYSIVLEDGFYEYANKVNGELVASGIRVHEPGKRDVREIAAASRIQKNLQPDQVPFKASILSQVVDQIKNKSMPTTGNIKVLALLIDYPDLQSTYSVNDFDSLLNGSSYNNGNSFSSFFYESSDGQLSIQVDVFGWYRANNNYAYYGSANGHSRAAELVREAVDAAEIAGVDFSRYDNDSDGDVDGILAVHSGPGAEQGSQTQYIWSHRWGLAYASPSLSVYYDGKLINDYIINPETRSSWSGTKMVGIGVFCHEFGHNLGLPDLYDTDDSNGGSEGLGNWCMMAGGPWVGGEIYPADFSAWTKLELGWQTPVNINPSTPGSYTLKAFDSGQSDILKVNITGVPNEYFLLENRQKSGLDTMIPGSGLAIYHINTLKTWGNRVNADVNDKGVDLEEADGDDDLDHENNRGDAGDLFPGTSLNRSFENNTYPNSKSNSFSNSGLEITNIYESNNVVTFDIGMSGAAGCNGLTTLTAASGNFSDGSGLSNYINNMDCSWLIQPGGTSTIDLTFTSFDTETGHDTVTVYDGNSASAPILGTFSGSNLPPTIQSTGSSLFVTFKTNSMTTAAGWEASYTSSSNPFLDITIDTVTINAAYLSTVSIPISSNGNWSVTDNVAWAAPNNNFGSGSGTITITAVQPNIGPKRYGMLYVEDALNSLIDSVVIEQLGSGKYLNVTPNIILFPVTPLDDDSIMIQSNVNWTLNNPMPWLTTTQNSGSTDAKILVTASDNTSKLSRFGNIDIQGSGNVSTHNILVFQAGPLYVSPTSFTMNVTPETFKASSDNQTPITAISPQSWLSTSKTIIPGSSGDPDTSLFQVIAAQNNTGASRDGIIVVDDTWSKDTVYINQIPSNNYVQASPDTIRFTDLGGLATFDIFSDTTWQISSATSFFSLNKTSGTYDDNVEVNAGPNTSLLAREGIIYISAVNDPQISDSIVVIQSAPLYLNVSPNAVLLNPTLGSMDSVEINANVNWNVSHSSSWLSINQTSGTGYTKLMITALSDNQTGSDRKDTLVFTSVDHVDVIVEVTQLDASTPTFSVSVDTVYLQNHQGSTAIFSVQSNQSWTISENSSWLILNPLSGTGIMDIDLMAASKNIVGNERVAKVTVSSPGFNDEEVTVIQLGSKPMLSVSKDPVILGSDSGSVETFNISSNLTSWVISTNANWFTVSPNTGSFTQQVELTSSDSNVSSNIRVDSVLISAPPHVPVYVMVLQDTVMTVGMESYDLANKVIVYPNPVREMLTVEFKDVNDISTMEVSLFDAIGKKVPLNLSRTANEIQFDVSHLEGGFYFMEISDGKLRTSRIISVVGQF